MELCLFGVSIRGTKEGGSCAGQIPKNNDVCEGSKTKFTKNTASRIRQDQAKVMPVGGQNEVTKQQDSVQVENMVDKSVNKGKTVSETYGAIHLSRDASWEKNEGKNKVIEIGSRSKPSKKVKIDEKEDIDVDKKAYPPGFRTLSTRMTPGKLSLTMKTLSDVQKEAVKLNYMLVDNYDPTQNRLKFVESKLMGTSEVKVVEKLIPVADVSCIDWCQYMIDCLESRKYCWKRDDRTCYYTGPMKLLLLAYVYSVKVPVYNLKKARPFIKYVRASHLDDIKKEEIKENRLGMGELEKRCSEYFDTSNADTDLQAF
ncbi:hypothetical protein L2E82_03469 [Cichorium intybus]|uniref:Uncharacterized protein n=1 Tax=Cichorium intybus TaxID=13427 RepID=A0ACB9H507_CICIN|nr:hypothetical protein L2E82_03469 [Cichorium intybus]